MAMPERETSEAPDQQLERLLERFPAGERSAYRRLLDEVTGPEEVRLEARPAGGRAWHVTVCAADWLGILSIVAGLFAARRIDIRSGDLFTLEVAGGQPQRRPAAARGRRIRRPPVVRRSVRRKILDIFQVETAEPVTAPYWEQVRGELARLVALLASGQGEKAREEIVDRVSAAARQHRETDRRLWPVTVHIDNDSAPETTRLAIHSVDTLGFLFEFSNALAMLDVNIQQVEIRTRGDEVDDTFWVSGARGGKITDPQRLDQLRLAAVLIKQFTHLLPNAPNPSQALRQFSALTLQLLSHPEWVQDVQSLRSGKVLKTVAELMGASQFLWEDFLRMQHENLFPVLSDQPALDQLKGKEDLARELQAECGGKDADAAAECLNQFKDREMFRIDLRHITRRIDFVAFSRELSDLADVVVDRAAGLAEQMAVAQFGTPRDAQGNPCSWCVGGLGKFGGRELGFASDIELIFIYSGGERTDGARPVEVSVFFEEWVSAFLRSLAARQEGIFQVDLRLRPYGKSGTLASPIDSFQKYFSPGGAAEQFERMALVKLRPVSGDAQLADRLIELRDAYVFSGRPLDLENIRHLRRRQATELVPRGAISAKHSPGGLVDIEYYVQAQQILAGARYPSVRVGNTLEAVERLRQVGWMDQRRAQQTAATYAFLRRLIDALRVVRGHARDLTLPDPQSREFDYLSRRLDYPSPAALQEDLQRHRRFAAQLWEEAPTTEPAGG